MIVEELHYDASTLAHLAASSKEFYNMAISHLYSKVSLGTPQWHRFIEPEVAYEADRRGVSCIIIRLQVCFLTICTDRKLSACC
jgi:hypothetical protein